MKCCVSTDVGTWTNWLTFEPDLDHSPDAGTGLLLPISYRLRNFAALRFSVAWNAALLRGILRQENPRYTYWRRAARASRCFKICFCSLSRRKTFVRGKCALPSALLVICYHVKYCFACPVFFFVMIFATMSVCLLVCLFVCSFLCRLKCCGRRHRCPICFPPWETPLPPVKFMLALLVASTNVPHLLSIAALRGKG